MIEEGKAHVNYMMMCVFDRTILLWDMRRINSMKYTIVLQFHLKFIRKQDWDLSPKY